MKRLFDPLFAFTPQYLEENLGALKVQLSPTDMKDVRAEADKADAAHDGARYPPGMDTLLFVDTPELKWDILDL